MVLGAVTYQGIPLSTFPYDVTICQTVHRQEHLLGLAFLYYCDCLKGEYFIGMYVKCSQFQYKLIDKEGFIN